MSARKEVDFWNLICREKRGAPEGWQWSRLEAIGDGPRAQVSTLVKGYVHNGARFKSGKRTGQLRPNSAVPGTERAFVIPFPEFDAFRIEWERRTGKCFECEGNGDVVQGYSVERGATYRACSRCSGTGRALEASP